jgi:hypothetical protein
VIPVVFFADYSQRKSLLRNSSFIQNSLFTYW